MIDGPTDPRDVDGWRAAIASLVAKRDSMSAEEYAALFTSLNAGLAGAMAPPAVIPKGNIRELLGKRRASA